MANPDTALAKFEKCSAPELYDAVTDYSFGHADEHKRRLVEAHLTACTICQHEVTKLTSAVEVLRFDRELVPPVTGNEVASTFGWSSRLHQPFAGHHWLAVISCVVYACLYISVMWVEVGLQYDRYAGQLLMRTPIVFGVMFITTFAALKICWRRASRGDGYALTSGFLILLAGALAAYGLSWWVLPRTPVNGASTPQEIYIQSVGVYLSFIVICLLLPFQFIVTMQCQLADGKHDSTLKLLRRDKDAVPARYAVYLRIWPILTLLTLQILSIAWMQSSFTSTVPPGKYRLFYVTVSKVAWFVYFVLGTSWMIWYSRMISELKRECLVATKFSE